MGYKYWFNSRSYFTAVWATGIEEVSRVAVGLGVLCEREEAKWAHGRDHTSNVNTLVLQIKWRVPRDKQAEREYDDLETALLYGSTIELAR
jgi:hypothetical protein